MFRVLGFEKKSAKEIEKSAWKAGGEPQKSCHAPLSDVNSGNKTLLEEDPSTVRGHKFEAGQYIQLFQCFFCCCCKREQENEAVDRGQDLCLGSSLVA